MDTKQGIVSCGNGELTFLNNVNVKKNIQDKFKLPCTVINDGKAAALAEFWQGNLQGVKNGAAVVLGTGVGGGLVIDGQLVRGNNNLAGELSFLLRTPCSANLNNVIGYSGSAVRFIKVAATSLDLSDKTDGIRVFEEIEKGENEVINHLFQTYCREIAAVLFNLQVVLDCEKIVIGGGISVQSIVIKEIRRQYHRLREGDLCIASTFSPLMIEACYFGNNANLIGAVYATINS